ncbi:MAG: hypothetical protein WC593_13450 [Methanoregula sp.]
MSRPLLSTGTQGREELTRVTIRKIVVSCSLSGHREAVTGISRPGQFSPPGQAGLKAHS